ncbi:hypothetical protein K493DRAFT_316344 [Basidiobolus meristosporus CBS 931.73]|uniref:Uncharacterized protein n=1 Tax=Basidiobolus meristosporus CBS 931.73 TaxID=1314790 RepID=A0A1Y1Y4D6_9FUNG|nr:hypothetical protein K493DRAFT_316344 [Basidiobolus meristosporus CBS 931.73]|eukprot:ORX92843.1 hypothetical protein K493DRAFT_316344 [Basidiobolus meristosporus CBS 931.73]
MDFVNRPNHMLERQKLFQSQVSKPVWLKGPRDKVLVTSFFVFLGAGLVGSLYGTVQLIRGKKD